MFIISYPTVSNSPTPISVFPRLRKFPDCRKQFIMELVYQISPSGNHIQVVGKGKITTNDCIGIIERVLSDPRCRSDSTALIDLSDAVYTYKDEKEVIRIAKALVAGKALLKNRIAIVAKQVTLFPAEILSLYMREFTHIKIRVFINLTSAIDYCKGGRSSTAKTRRPSSG